MYPGFLTYITRSRVPSLLIAICCIASASATAQESSPRKFDAFNDLNTDDTQARLDLFAQELINNEKRRGLVVGYRSSGTLPGSHLRKIFGYLDYLANSRGVNPENLEAIDAGTAGNTLTELWLVPRSAKNPTFPNPPKLIPNSRFDQVLTGDGCLPEYTIELYEPKDALQFFATALSNNPQLKGLIVVHPSRHHIRQGLWLLNKSKAQLLNCYNVAAKQLNVELLGHSVCTTMTLWLVPLTFSTSRGVTAEEILLSQLMGDAEKKRYTLRRIEFIGNTWTRDSTLRKQAHELREGDLFSYSSLRHSLKNLSRLRSIYPVRISDVDAYLNPDESTLDLTIYVRPRFRKRR